MTLLESINISLGTLAPDFSLTGVGGKIYDLSDFSDAKILVVVFMCNHCPYVQAIWGRLVKLQEKYKDRGVQFVGINPNKNPDYPEETIEHMEKYFAKYQMNFPYLIDETQEVAREYGAVCTPDIFVFDSERKLAYHGRVDDNWKDERGVTRNELEEALMALLKREKPSDIQNSSRGCSIKWRE